MIVELTYAGLVLLFLLLVNFRVGQYLKPLKLERLNEFQEKIDELTKDNKKLHDKINNLSMRIGMSIKD